MLNNQQILNICLKLISWDESEFEGDAGEFITYHVIMENLPKQLSPEELEDKVRLLITNYNLSSLVEKGLVDRVFDEGDDVRYTLTEE